MNNNQTPVEKAYQQQLQKRPTQVAMVKSLLETPALKKRFQEILAEKAPYFLSSLISLASNELKDVEPNSIVNAAAQAASMNLMINKSLGQAWIIPFNNSKKGVKEAQFIIGYKGWIQMALRTGQYRAINATEIFEGELVKWNPLTEELIYDPSKRTGDEIIAYGFHMELVNGFKKTDIWLRQDAKLHEKRFVKNPRQDMDEHKMAIKRLVSYNLRTWGLLSVEMEKASLVDEAVATGSEPQDFTPVEDLGYQDDIPETNTPADAPSAEPTQQTAVDSSNNSNSFSGTIPEVNIAEPNIF